MLNNECVNEIDGTAGPSFLTTLLEETMEGGRLSAEDERTLRGISSVLYAGGLRRRRVVGYEADDCDTGTAGTDTVGFTTSCVRLQRVFY